MKRLALCALTAVLSACAARAPATWPAGAPGRLGVGLNNFGQATVPLRGKVIFEGDDLCYGTALKDGQPGGGGSSTPRSDTPIPDTIYETLHGSVSVEIRCLPDDTIAAGVQRWGARAPGSLLVVAYGFGDAKAGTKPEAFKAALTGLVAAAHAADTPIFLIVPPGSTDRALDGKLDYYRNIVRDLRDNNVSVLEAGQLIAGARARPTRGPAQSDAGYRAIAAGLVPYIRVASGG